MIKTFVYSFLMVMVLLVTIFGSFFAFIGLCGFVLSMPLSLLVGTILSASFDIAVIVTLLEHLEG